MIGVPARPVTSSPRINRPAAVVGEAEFLARTQHPVGHHAAEACAGDFEAPRKDRADGAERHPVPNLEVGGTAHDLERLGSAAVDDGEADLSAPFDRHGCRAPVPPPRRSSPSPTCSIASTTSPRSSRVTQHPDVVGERSEITEPAQRSTHGGLSRCGARSELREEADVVLQKRSACLGWHDASAPAGRCRTRRRKPTTRRRRSPRRRKRRDRPCRSPRARSSGCASRYGSPRRGRRCR